ncbi:MAG: M23 family metallopeptidase [Gaiellales bacterium]
MRIARLLAALATAALGLAATAVGAESPGASASATAFGVLVQVGGETAASVGSASAPPRGAGGAGAFSYPDDGSVVRTGPVETSVRTGPGSAARATAAAAIQRVELFGGEVVIDAVSVSVEAMASRTEAGGNASGSTVTGLEVDGAGIAAGPNERVELGDWGYAVVLEQAVTSTSEGANAHRSFVVGLHVRLTADHGGLPAGSEILIGYAEAAARWPLPAPAEPADGPAASPDNEQPGHGSGSGGPRNAPDQPTPATPGSQPSVPAIVRNPPPGVKPDITGRGYVFPVFGPASFSDDFGYPRAHTGWHHGNDIFAPLGSPVLAVADGTLFSVGWNQVGGWRLWLRDGQGNEYYYAHMSAYSPLAVNGTRVQAGDVVGFVGDSGDARGTPTHLHFEIHPAALLGLGYDGVVDPYPYLLGWHAAQDVDVSVAPASSEVGSDPAPEPAAGLVESSDISSASGLVPGALAEALALPVFGGEEGSPVPVSAPTLVGGPPGF